MNNLLADARRLRNAGLSIIPIRADGSKAAATAWKAYQSRLPTDTEITDWFQHPGYGLVVFAGAISGGLEIVDFDAVNLFAPWADLVEELCSGLRQRLPVGQTPTDGRHVYYRCATIAGNQKLAQHPDALGRPETDIETRGEGGYVLAPGSPLACHPLGKPYVLLDGDLTDIPTITPEERHLLHQAARTFNTYTPPERPISTTMPAAEGQASGTRPGDDYAVRTSWETILEPHGYVQVRSWKGATLWRRPGKRQGWSVVTGGAEPGLLWSYSTNAAPFELEHAYSKFAAYALLNHAGDFTAAAKSLADAGYGDRNGVTGGDRHASPGDGLNTLPIKPYTGYRGYRGLRRG
jgi:putative DNA primase/helicase